MHGRSGLEKDVQENRRSGGSIEGNQAREKAQKEARQKAEMKAQTKLEMDAQERAEMEAWAILSAHGPAPGGSLDLSPITSFGPAP